MPPKNSRPSRAPVAGDRPLQLRRRCRRCHRSRPWRPLLATPRVRPPIKSVILSLGDHGFVVDAGVEGPAAHPKLPQPPEPFCRRRLQALNLPAWPRPSWPGGNPRAEGPTEGAATYPRTAAICHSFSSFLRSRQFLQRLRQLLINPAKPAVQTGSPLHHPRAAPAQSPQRSHPRPHTLRTPTRARATPQPHAPDAAVRPLESPPI